ncbi:MAG: protein kinase [Gemmatimonadetes bacterium]|nr:protein kinase [Gemmatimonadota bacterium]
MTHKDLTPRLNAALAGRYRVDREIGRGGMATVYLAEDIKHQRNVALKVLHPELGVVLGAERFLAEIRTTANLQHPNILPLYDSGAADGLVFYVMPYIEGESLRDRMTREGQLPIGDAIRLIQGAASALDYAHRHGVIHRDIKPENILLQDGQALVADFGVALAVTNAAGMRITQTGMSVGTPAYMSPEQAAAERTVDGRSDVYSLAAVMYEMLCGEAPFTGPSAAAIMSRMMTEVPRAVDARRPSVPVYVSDAVHRSLEKIPGDRFASAADFSHALDKPGTGTYRAAIRSARSRRREVVYAVAAVVLATGAWYAGRGGARGTENEQPPSRLLMPAVDPAFASTDREIDISPNGDELLFKYKRPDGRITLARQALDATDPIPFLNLPADIGNPVFGPDGKWFVASVAGDRHLYRQSITSGTAESLPIRAVGFTVDGRGRIWYQNDAQELAYLDANNKSIAVKGLKPNLLLMQILPSERYALMERRPAQGAASGPIIAVDLTTGAETTVIGSETVEAYYTSGLLVYIKLDGTINAAPFDLSTRTITGSSVTVASGVASFAVAQFAVSRNGTLAYRPQGPRNIVLLNRTGQTLTTVPGADFSHSPKFSPDGRRIAFDVTDADGRDVWLYDVGSRALTRTTFAGNGHDVAWSPDGHSIAFLSARAGTLGIFSKRADGSTQSDSLLTSSQIGYSGTWLKDGKSLLTVVLNLKAKSGSDIALVRNGGHGPIEPVLATEYEELYPMLSPDERWLAYSSDQSGRQEVYVRPFGREGDQAQVSLAGGTEPVWSKDGKELFFRTFDKGTPVLAVAAIQTVPALAVASRTNLFPVGDIESSTPHPDYDVSPDGKSFAMSRRTGGSPNIVIIQNLPALVKKLQGATAAPK